MGAVSEKKGKGERKVVESYKIVYEGADGELVEKKSRFIAQIRPVASEEEAFAFIEEVHKKYWDARHHCYAYIIGERAQTARCSDDGEPSQTAGKPMMDVLAGEGLHDVCAVVTRYFGGTLLGTGGLVRAYSGAVKEALLNCSVVEKSWECSWRSQPTTTAWERSSILRPRRGSILWKAGIPIRQSLIFWYRLP